MPHKAGWKNWCWFWPNLIFLKTISHYSPSSDPIQLMPRIRFNDALIIWFIVALVVISPETFTFNGNNMAIFWKSAYQKPKYDMLSTGTHFILRSGKIGRNARESTLTMFSFGCKFKMRRRLLAQLCGNVISGSGQSLCADSNMESGSFIFPQSSVNICGRFLSTCELTRHVALPPCLTVSFIMRTYTPSNVILVDEKLRSFHQYLRYCHMW